MRTVPDAIAQQSDTAHTRELDAVRREGQAMAQHAQQLERALRAAETALSAERRTASTELANFQVSAQRRAATRREGTP